MCKAARRAALRFNVSAQDGLLRSDGGRQNPLAHRTTLRYP